MDEQTISAEERLKQLNTERKELKEKVYIERSQRLRQAENMRVERDLKIVKIREKLDLILSAIFKYNKLGKVNKNNCDIIETINAILNVEDELSEESEEELAEVHSEKVE